MPTLQKKSVQKKNQWTNESGGGGEDRGRESEKARSKGRLSIWLKKKKKKADIMPNATVITQSSSGQALQEITYRLERRETKQVR